MLVLISFCPTFSAGARGVLPVPLRLLILMQAIEYLPEPEDGLDIVRLLGEDFLAALPRLHELIQLRIRQIAKVSQ